MLRSRQRGPSHRDHMRATRPLCGPVRSSRAVRRGAKPWRKRPAAWRPRTRSGTVRRSSRITPKLADLNPYRGGPKGRVKSKSTKFDNFSRDQATIVPMAALGPKRRLVRRSVLVAIGGEGERTSRGHSKSVAHDPYRPFALRIGAMQRGQRASIPIIYSITSSAFARTLTRRPAAAPSARWSCGRPRSDSTHASPPRNSACPR